MQCVAIKIAQPTFPQHACYGITYDAAGKDTSPSQTVRAQLQLRELVLSGELSAGVRIAELSIVERHVAHAHSCRAGAA